MATTPSSRLPLLIACGGSLLAFLDVTITNLAVPDLVRDLDQDVTSLSWVVTLYTLLFAALLAPAGRLADVLGRTRLFAAGIATFTVGSALAAAAPDLGLLLGARAVQGVGAAMLLPASLALVLADTPPAKRPAAIGLWAASASVAAAAGPAIGGVLVDAFGWRALFLINLPLGLWLLVQARRLGTPARSEAARLPDVVGAALATAAVGLLVLALTQGDGWGWGAAPTLLSFAGAAAAGTWAVARSARHPAPALQIDLWRNPTYATANAVSLLFGAALYAWLLVGVLFLTDAWGYTELEAGLAMTPGAVVSAGVGIAISRVARRPSPRALVVVGAIVLGLCGLAIWLWLPEQPAFLTLWLPTGTACGLGIGAVSVGVSSAAALSVAPERFAAATGLNIAARQVGGAVGVAILAVLLAGHVPGDGIEPFRSVYLMTVVACAGVAVAGMRLVLAPPAAAAVAAAPAAAGGTAR
ncbi:MAG TPA: MFS transporter [Capillimicrobium sp.]|nr:MFS transporter [Capillimicrobium sp.]